MTEQKQTATTEITPEEKKINTAFTTAINAKKGEDEIKLAMIHAGCSFKSVTTKYKKLMIAAGRMMSKDDVDKVVDAACAKANLSTEDAFANVIAKIEVGAKCESKRAAQLVRSYAKQNEMEVWVKPKGERKAGLRAKLLNSFVENPTMDQDEFNKLMSEDWVTENMKKNQAWWNSMRKTVNAAVANA